MRKETVSLGLDIFIILVACALIVFFLDKIVAVVILALVALSRIYFLPTTIREFREKKKK